MGGSPDHRSTIGYLVLVQDVFKVCPFILLLFVLIFVITSN